MWAHHPPHLENTWKNLRNSGKNKRRNFTVWLKGSSKAKYSLWLLPEEYLKFRNLIFVKMIPIFRINNHCLLQVSCVRLGFCKPQTIKSKRPKHCGKPLHRPLPVLRFKTPRFVSNRVSRETKDYRIRYFAAREEEKKKWGIKKNRDFVKRNFTFKFNASYIRADYTVVHVRIHNVAFFSKNLFLSPLSSLVWHDLKCVTDLVACVRFCIAFFFFFSVGEFKL